VHDFPSDAVGKSIPYGVYDLAANDGFVSVGVDHDTPVFAVTSIGAWWAQVGSKRNPKAREIFINADADGSNSYRSHVWKHQLQRLADKLRMSIHVSHFPPGSSKWNKVRAPTVLIYLDKLARSAAADLRDGHRPDRQHNESRRVDRASATRSSPLSNRQESVSQRTPRAQHRALRLPGRLELRHQAETKPLIG